MSETPGDVLVRFVVVPVLADVIPRIELTGSLTVLPVVGVNENRLVSS